MWDELTWELWGSPVRGEATLHLQGGSLASDGPVFGPGEIAGISPTGLPRSHRSDHPRRRLQDRPYLTKLRLPSPAQKKIASLSLSARGSYINTYFFQPVESAGESAKFRATWALRLRKPDICALDRLFSRLSHAFSG
jgi:hypothetical protein